MINARGLLGTTGPHYPQTYDQRLLIVWVEALASQFKVYFPPDIVSMLIEELESDFSYDYLQQFPYVLRIVSGNSFKRKEYSQGFSLPNVEFMSYDFVEIQGTEDEIVEHKLSQLPDEPDEVMMIDDTSLELKALDGFPGPYVKAFFSKVSHESVCSKLAALGTNDAYVVHTIGVSLRSHKFSQMFRFPVKWGASCGEGHSFDPYCYFRSQPLAKLNGYFRQIIAFWIKMLIIRYSKLKESEL